MDVMINVNDFTLAELEQLEQLTGMTFAEIAENFNRPKVIKVILWLSNKRTNPEAKIEDYANLTLAEATRLITGEPDPKA
jgi:hypothetical protein